jgi:hypothetical protein
MLVDVQTISIVIADSGVFIAAVNQILSRRRADKTAQLQLETRQAQLFMQLYNRYSSREFRTAITKIMEWTCARAHACAGRFMWLSLR